jgi:hypothetical protein
MSNKWRKKGSADAHFFVYTPGSVLPRDVTHVLVHHSVEVLPARAFADCKHLKEVVLQEGLSEIGMAAFRDCVSLEHVTLPSTLAKIGVGAFLGCKSLRELAPLEGLAEIGVQTFQGCTSLERIRLPSALASIGDYAFGGCHSLKLVKICGVIQLIRAEAFYHCALLDNVTIPAKALVVTGPQGNRQFSIATDGTFSPSNSTQVVIVSDCFNTMRTADLSDAELRITEILGLQLQGGWDAQRERLRDFLVPYELQHKKNLTTLLELGLWKAKMEESASGNPETREECRVNCGAMIIISNVLSFL